MNLVEARKLLGVRSSTSLNRITRAYRKRVFIVHPDRNPNDKDADTKVRRLTEAWEVAKRGVGIPLGSIFYRVPVSQSPSDPFAWASNLGHERSVFDDLADELRKSTKSPSGRDALDELFGILKRTTQKVQSEGRDDPLSVAILMGLGILTSAFRRQS